MIYLFVLLINIAITGLTPVQATDAGDAGLRQTDALYDQYRKSEDLAAAREAARLLDAKAKQSPDNYEVWWRRARVYYSLGDDTKPQAEKITLFQTAIDSATRAVSIKPDGVEGHYWLGVSDGGFGEAKGKFKAMSLIGTIRKEMETVLKLDARYENAGAWLVLGRMDFELPGIMGGSNKRAIQEYQEGLKLAPDNQLIRVYLAESYIDDGRRDEARQMLDQVLAIKPGPDQSPQLKDAQHEARKIYNKHFAGKK